MVLDTRRLVNTTRVDRALTYQRNSAVCSAIDLALPVLSALQL